MTSEPSQQTMLFSVEPEQTHSLPYGTMRSMEPLSRRQDPVGSFEAADGLKRHGFSGRQRLAVYHALRAHQGSTSAELARIMDVDRYQPSRRLPELEKAGWVCRGRRRRCSVSGIDSVTWWIKRPWVQGQKATAQVPSRGDSDQGGGRHEAGPAKQTPPDMVGDAGGSITTPEERRELRQRLAAEGPPEVRRFIQGIRERDGSERPARASPA